MNQYWKLPVAATVLFSVAALGQMSQRAPSNLLVQVSVTPYPVGDPILVPGDRSDKSAFVAEILLLHPPTNVAYGHKRFVVFPGEPAKGSFPAADLSVDYIINLDLQENRAETKVRVHRGQEFVCGSAGEIWLARPKAGIQPAPGR